MRTIDDRQDQQLRELEWASVWLLRGVIGLGVCFGLLGWWVLMKGCG